MYKKKETVCAVVVTYNRKQLLGECLDALLNQTRPVDAIYIIDNASTDGTPEYLVKKGFIDTPLYPDKGPLEAIRIIPIPSSLDKTIKIHYVRMHENTGGAGGFHEGVKRGYRKGYDWLWLMDDDVKPLPNSLEALIRYSFISKCIHPTKINVNGNPFYEHQKMKRNRDKDYFFVNACCFEGCLIHKDIVKKVGFPDKRFFITGDDAEYGLRVSKVTPIIYLWNVKIIKLLSEEHIYSQKIRKSRHSVWKTYYLIRNMFLVKELHFQNNYFYNLKIIYSIFRVILTTIFFDNNKLMRIKYIINGIKDGLNKKFNLLPSHCKSSK
jgi:GT2 family glycosyltransferase